MAEKTAEEMLLRKHWLQVRIGYLLKVMEDPDISESDGVVQEYQDCEGELESLNDRLRDMSISNKE